MERVLGGDPRHLVKLGDELWVTAPGSYDAGMRGEVAAAAFVSMESYAPAAYVNATSPGTKLIAFVETSADRAARGRKVSGLDGGWWLTAQDAFEGPGQRAKVERIRRAHPGPRPAKPR
ncbi:MAG: hypothetical protein QM767_20645 [Anaeromyxobacter sp.]